MTTNVTRAYFTVHGGTLDELDEAARQRVALLVRPECLIRLIRIDVTPEEQTFTTLRAGENIDQPTIRWAGAYEAHISPALVDPTVPME